MERSLIFLILGLGVVWVILREFSDDPNKRIITNIVKGLIV